MEMLYAEHDRMAEVIQAMQKNSQGRAHEELSAAMKSSEESKKAIAQTAEVRAS